MLQRLQLVSVAESSAFQAWSELEDRVWREDLESSPHGRPWHTSFHASSLPGNPDTACARKALYGLLDIPNPVPVDQYGRGIMEAGNAIEEMYVARYEQAGMLLSQPHTARVQTGFSAPEFWLSGNLDAIIRPRGWNRGHVVEFKGKDHDKIDAMRRGEMSYDFAHYYQLQTYLGFLQTDSFRVYQEFMDGFGGHSITVEQMGLTEPVASGSILYVSRQRPRHTYEFYFDFDPVVWETATSFLKEWKQNFLDGELPARRDWRWTEQPCAYCPVKKLCKADYKAGVTRLKDSEAVKFAKTLRPKYDYDETRKSVLDRWGENE